MREPQDKAWQENIPVKIWTHSSQGNTLNPGVRDQTLSLHKPRKNQNPKGGKAVSWNQRSPSQTLKHKDPGMRNLLLNCWSWGSKRLPKTILVLLPLVTSHRLKSRFYCWRHQALGTMGLRDVGLDVTLKPPPWGQAFIILAGALEAAKAGEQSIVIPINHKMTNMVGCPKVLDSGTHIWQ